MAAAVVAGAWLALSVPVVPCVLFAVLSLVLRRPVLFTIFAALLASGLAATAWAGLAGVESDRWVGPVTLLEDPEVDGYGAIRVVARAGEHHVQLVARGGPAGRLGGALAGQAAVVEGRIESLDPSANWLAHRHVAARLTVEFVGEWRRGTVVARVANAYRQRLVHGARAGLSRREGSLLLGLTLGDDRNQDAGLTDAFRASGLTHLLAVSGQNVAFVLAVAGPVLARVGSRSRLIAALAVLGFFAVVTRLEPSVLRATAMAGGAVLARTWGREATATRLLAIAVAGLVLVDPLLVGSLAFQLSVAATWGIVVFSGPIAERLRGPAWVREPIAVTVSAQLAVAPLQIWQFGGLPMASLPANLLAGGAAGPAMIWGMTGGFVAGFVGDAGATVVHVPTRALVGWIAVVAERSADLPLGSLGRVHLVAGLALGSILWLSGLLHRHRREIRAVVAGVAIAVVIHGAVFGVLPRTDPVVDIRWLGDGADELVVVSLPSTGSPERLLEDLRRAEVSRIDVVLADRGNRSQGRMVAAIRDRHPVGVVLAPAHHQVVSARVPPLGMMVAAGPTAIEVLEVEPELVVAVVGEG